MLLNQVGLNYSSIGEYDQALKIHQQAFDLLETHGHPFTQSIIQNNIATNYLHLGDYRQAIGILTRSIEISKKLGDTRSLALGYNNLAYYYIFRGEIEQAQNYQTQSLTLHLKLGNKRDLSVAYKLLAEIHYQRNQLKDAFESYHKSLEFQLEIGNELEISLSLFGLIEISIELDQTNVTKEYLNQLLDMDSHNPLIKNIRQIAEAIDLMSGGRLKDLVQAQDIFDHLLKKENLQNHFRIKLLVYYCKFLFIELKISSNKEDLRIVQKLIDDLIIIAKQQQSHIISIHSLILKSKLLQVEGKYSEANQILEDLRHFCHDKDLTHMTTIVEYEVMLLDKFINKWISMVESGENLSIKIHESKILSYLDLIASNINKK